MNEYGDIETAARHRDWQGCARLLFLTLLRCTKEQQLSIAAHTLETYAPIWKAKHTNALQRLPDTVLANDTQGNGRVFSGLLENIDLDPADTEFENGLLEFQNGVSSLQHRRHTAHFATAVRSGVTARQINKWLQNHADDYAKWSAGRSFNGPTFLDDEPASEEALSAWRFVDHLFRRQHVNSTVPFVEKMRSSRDIERQYRKWEETIF